MSDFGSRLRDADPATGLNYEHPNANAMISRIIATTPRERSHVLRSFQLRMAGAVTMATVLTVGGIAALENAAPTLQILSLSATGQGPYSTTGAYSPSVPKYSTMRIYEQFNFSAGSSLSTGGSSGAAYQLRLPANPSAEAARIGSIFAVSGTPTDQNGDGSDWNVSDSNGSSVDVSNYGGVPQWFFNLSSLATSSVTPGTSSTQVPSLSALDADVQGLLRRLGYAYQVGDPQVSTATVSGGALGQTSDTTNEETVSYVVLVNGVSTDQTLQLSVDSNNQILNASGPAFTLQPLVNYPLRSPVSAVAVLDAQQKAEFATNASGGVNTGSGTGGTVTSGASGSSPAPPTPDGSGTGPTTIAPSGPATVDVTLDGVTLKLQSYWLTDGTVWLLPVYDFTGTVVTTDGSSYQGDWTTIAVDPAYVNLDVTSRESPNPKGLMLY